MVGREELRRGRRERSVRSYQVEWENQEKEDGSESEAMHGRQLRDVWLSNLVWKMGWERI